MPSPATRPGRPGRCLILARRRLAELRESLAKQATGELAVVEERLDAANALRNRSPQTARAMYQAVVELYAGKPWAAAAVGRARKASRGNESEEALSLERWTLVTVDSYGAAYHASF